MSVAEFIFRKAGEVFNFTNDRLRLLVPHGIWEIFTTYISCTPAASYFYYYVMPRSLLLDTSVLVCIYFDGDTGRSLLSVCLIISLQDHLLFPIFHANTNYISLNWGCMTYSCLLYSRIFVGEGSYLPASSIQQII